MDKYLLEFAFFGLFVLITIVTIAIYAVIYFLFEIVGVFDKSIHQAIATLVILSIIVGLVGASMKINEINMEVKNGKANEGSYISNEEDGWDSGED